MTISDEMLMAYLDNELSPDERARVDAALIADADLRARLQRQNRVHAMLETAFGPSVTDPVPERFLDLVRRTPVSWRWRLSRGFSELFGGAQAGGFVARFAPAMALLVVGIGVGLFFARMTSGDDGAPLAARGVLAQALEVQLASHDVLSGPRVGVTFRSKDGVVCRTFDMNATRDNRAGVACRGADGGWAITALAAAPARTGSVYETASAGMPDPVRDAVAQMMGGEAFDAEAERRARDAGWR